MSKYFLRKRARPLIAFFGHPDVFEDFYPHYGVDQDSFATKWSSSGNHAFIALIQKEIADVEWYEFSLAPELIEARHQGTGCKVRFFASSRLHRALWRLFYLPRPAWRWRAAYPIYSLFASYLAPLSFEFLRSIWKSRPNIVFAQDYSTGRFDILLILARLLGARIVARHAGSRSETYVGRLIRRWTLPNADCLMVSNRREVEFLESSFKVPSDRLEIVLTPIDVDTFCPIDRTAACSSVDLSPIHRWLLFVGRLDDRVKRVSSLIRVFGALAKDFPDVELLIVGDGRDANELRALAREVSPQRIHFRGWVDSEVHLSFLFNAAECLVLPSLSEGFPKVVGEAISAGTPVVASDVGGISELVVPAFTGWLVPPGDEAALKRSLTEVLTAPHTLQKMRLNARSLALQRVAPAVVTAQLRRCLLGDDELA